ncbi:ABC transporter ATP-binding protein [Deinococcus metallilatus]|uniref:ABC-type Fe3+/spermidine/putrescine transport system ATPase subunit n=1 Tax=Deinococcus metallilatus TaxID=1211322 RepID=A0ABR6MUS2_9DEIO|nr:ABC transporter ATP-binding protein [Deinococcus metallilatus]MBB5295685.1 ABC-type Fe3+/spermidine/putrescine transport system ATPase subunit [Deinococcus metallilatus]GMA14215.1 ABC transporter ATP-binding protein [Deinococcus metallilatus]
MSTVEFTNVTKLYGQRPAVANLNLRVGSGELICLLGPSGCGKTTTLRMLAGFITPDAGDIGINERSVLNLGPEARPTALVFQRYTLWPHMNIFHNVAFGLKLRRVPADEIRRKVAGALDLVGLQGLEKRFPAQLSGGQQQRVALARALVIEPQVLLLDEPLSSLDAKLRVQLRQEIRAIQKELGITTVFVTHDQEEAMSVADRIAVMHDGVLQQVEAPGELYARPATEFVARFMGEMNVLPGTQTGSTVRTGRFEFLTDLPASASAGKDLRVAFRPEDVQLGTEGVPGRVMSEIDLGHYRQLILDCGGVTVTAFVSKGQPVRGNHVRVARVLMYAGGQFVSEACAAEPV